MSRRLAFSNGRLYVELNDQGLVDTVHFPHVGHESHTGDTPHRVGVWVDGQISWIDDGGWARCARYDEGSLSGYSVVHNESLGVLLEFNDAIDVDSNFFYRNIHVVNTMNRPQRIKLFMHQAFNIGHNLDDDTAQFIENPHSILHYGGNRSFVISGITDEGVGFDQHSVGLYGQGRDGTWRDAESGNLSLSNSERGLTDSTIRFSLDVEGLSSRRLHYWLAVANSPRSAFAISESVERVGVERRSERSTKLWRRWLQPSVKIASKLKPGYQKVFLESLMIIRAHIDNKGSLVTSSDGYSDPSAALYAIWPLVRLGYEDESLQLFDFFRSVINSNGSIGPSYRASGALAPTSLPFIGSNPPFRSEQTALAVFVFSQTYLANKHPRLLKDYYQSLVVPMANFLADFTDEKGLPLASYDLRGGKLQISAYAISVTYAALVAASEMAEEAKDQNHMVKWRSAADDMRQTSKGIIVNDFGSLAHSLTDSTPSISALFGAFMYDLVDVDSPMMLETVKFLEETRLNDEGLLLDDNDGGAVDYVGSLHLAQYYLEVGRASEAGNIVDRTKAYLEETSMASADQVWLRAELISTMLDTITRK